MLTVPRDLITAVPAGAAPTAYSTAPARAASTLSVPPAPPAAVEINVDGLPQRRRAAPAPRLGGLPGADAALNGSGAYPVSAAPAAAPAHAAPAAPAAPPAPTPPPGLWLAAFQDAVSGDPAEGAKAAAPRPDFDEPSGKEGRQS